MPHQLCNAFRPRVDFENLSHYLQSKLGLKNYLRPTLVGYSSGVAEAGLQRLGHLRGVRVHLADWLGEPSGGPGVHHFGGGCSELADAILGRLPKLSAEALAP